MLPYEDEKLAPRQRALDLLSRMTLREKVGQLTQRLYGFRVYERHGQEIALVEEFRQEVERYSGLGTLYGLYRADPWSGKDFTTGLDGALAPKARNQVQRYVLEHSRLRIPVLMSTECPHGHQALDGYLLPVNLAAGATFSPAALEAAAEVAGKQLRQMGVDLALVSALDVLRDPVGDAVRSASARIRSWPPVWPRRLSGGFRARGWMWWPSTCAPRERPLAESMPVRPGLVPGSCGKFICRR